MSRIRFRNFLRFGVPSLCGIVRSFAKDPRFIIRLVFARADLCFRGRVHPLTDPAGYELSSASDLIQYWGFFIERNINREEWCPDFRLMDSPAVIDIGANVGIFCHLLNTLNPTVKILALEPQPKATARIRAMASMTKANVSVVEAACSDRNGYEVFHSHGDLDTTGSLESTWDPHDNRICRAETQVPVLTLDSLDTADPIYLIIIDVEGHEEAVLRGATAILAKTRWLRIEDYFGNKLDSYLAILGSKWQYVRRLGAIDCLLKNTEFVSS